MLKTSTKYLLFAMMACGLLAGCDSSENNTGGSSVSSEPVAVSSEQPMSAMRPGTDADSSKLSPIDAAQKDYLDAYNDYVRLLRESGPQTIETLQALAIYQKNYQLYQMLVKATAGDTATSTNRP